MHRNCCSLTVGFIAVLGFVSATQHAAHAGDPERGQEAFQQCAACHSLAPGEHGMGPSLHDIVGRTAGAADGFAYSEALEDSGIAWTESNLDEWLADPDAMIPGNQMPFPGIEESEMRADIIAYLKAQGAD